MSLKKFKRNSLLEKIESKKVSVKEKPVEIKKKTSKKK